MNTNELEVRLQHLERRLNRYRTTAGLLGLTVIALIGVAASSPGTVSDEVRTRKLVVVGADGRDAVQLRATEQGGAMTMHNRKGFPVVALGAMDMGGEMYLADKGDQRCVALTVNAAGGRVEVKSPAGQNYTIAPTGPSKADK